MAVLQNARHELFAQELAKGKTATEAYVTAGYKHNDSNACQLSKKVQARVTEINGRGAVRAEITVADLIQEAADIQSAAIADGQHAAAVSALTAKAKLAGLWVERAVSENQNVNYAVSDTPATADEWAAKYSDSAH